MDELDDKAARFPHLVGMELRGAIAASGWAANAVARETGHSASALSGWLSGKRALPLAVLYQICALIGASPRDVIARAVDRLDREADSSEPGGSGGSVSGTPSP